MRADANQLVRRIPCDVLYIDPPYNVREYAANYHVLDTIATRAYLDGPALEAAEASIYGKSGLSPYRKSDFSSRLRCREAFRALVAGARARRVVVSYNEEGILSREEIEDALRDGLGAREREFRALAYKRFRSDRDRDARSYRVLPDRGRDEIAEWLFYAERPVRLRPAPSTCSLSRRAAAGEQAHP
jgi:adenine-specific DNA-methyltransferase